ncbi:MAG: LysE family translocator [Polaromonas sp.]|uniref:LysE family translocator n=1 Tax=Polaromonas sp. TaxID=1869339 RepID=UPI0027305E85|nr:LysE family translocator [Polaromonas sp.]MDP1742352.1 LysE family translocator [Polaromonas sp.]MDP1954492.1 LysE family translocator [Polaromonas sp.]MDP3355100.1 LysE family translocator [Polaromonas sp.]MDP3753539.1 LysE family translocator [Polaromonas sp.]
MDTLALTQTSHLWLFFVMVFGIIVLPGLDMAFVMASSLVDGRRSGLSAVAGTMAGGAVHVVLGAIGVGAILAIFPLAFQAMLLVGTLYIGWMGLSLWRGATALGEIGDARSRSLSATFGRAALTCLLNPKAYMFMLAVFPQFLRPSYGPIWLQAVVLGLIIALTQGTVYGAIALGAAHVKDWLRHNPRSQVRLGQAVGGVLILAASWTAWSAWQAL